MNKIRLSLIALLTSCALVNPMVAVPAAHAVTETNVGARFKEAARGDIVGLNFASFGTVVDFLDAKAVGTKLSMVYNVAVHYTNDAYDSYRRLSFTDSDPIIKRELDDAVVEYVRTTTNAADGAKFTLTMAVNYKTNEVTQRAEFIDLRSPEEQAKNQRKVLIQVTNQHFGAPGMNRAAEIVGKNEGVKFIHAEQPEGFSATMVPSSGYLSARVGDTWNSSPLMMNKSNGVEKVDDSAKALFAVWVNDEAVADASLTAQVTTTFASDPAAVDTDLDGIPDGMERKLAAKYGTNPEEKDLFLQLNWMSSERREKECSDKKGGFSGQDRVLEHLNATSRTEWYLTCSKLKSTHYAPSHDDLRAMIEIFDEAGINLYIDAGTYFSNMKGFAKERGQLHGGPIKEYRDHWFEGRVIGQELMHQYNTRITGERRNLFRLGIIGGRQLPNNDSSGMGLVGFDSFYVARPAVLPENYLLNTLVHEFGHNLNLGHGGPYETKDGKNPFANINYLPEHKSTMNYRYQLNTDEVNYTFDEIVTAPVSSATVDECRAKLPDRWTTECPVVGQRYVIPAEWPNLAFDKGYVGKSPESILEIEEQILTNPVEVRPESQDIAELIDVNPDSHDGVATFKTVAPQQLLQFSDDNTLRVEIGNVSNKEETFTLFYSYADRNEVQRVTLPPRGQDGAVQQFDIPMPGLEKYADPNLEVSFQLVNSDSKEQFSDSETFSFLALTAKEAEQEVSKVIADPKTDAAVKEVAQKVRDEAQEAIVRETATAKPTTAAPTTARPVTTVPTTTSAQPTTTPARPTKTASVPAPAPKPMPTPVTTTAKSDAMNPMTTIFAVILGLLGFIGSGIAAYFAGFFG